MKINYFSKAEIADMVGLKPKTFQRWSKDIGLNYGRGMIPEECIPEIREKIRQYAVDKVKKQSPSSPPNNNIS
ncbi:MAG: hypothetical protein U5L45_15070 [Saprospiraceae bacterium]|nr:hypothetical protein [Saprospiraceae bacterium]